MNAPAVVPAARKWNGKPIAMPSIVHGMPLETYHSAEACDDVSMSSSGLRTIFNKSPKHYWATSPYNPDRIERDETPSMVLGRAAHHLLFGEEDFRKVFVLRPATVNGEAWHSSKTICKEWTRRVEAEGLTVLTTAQIDTIRGMAKSLGEEPLVRAGILGGQIEHSWFWKDKETNIWLRMRPDASPNDSLDFVDLKTTASVALPDLSRTIFDYGYHQQAALVADGCLTLLKKPMTSFTLVFIESKAPYCVRIVTLKDDDIALGRKANRLALRTFTDCMKKKHWPGPGGDQMDAAYIEIPGWAKKQLEDRVNLELKETTSS